LEKKKKSSGKKKEELATSMKRGKKGCFLSRGDSKRRIETKTSNEKKRGSYGAKKASGQENGCGQEKRGRGNYEKG